MLDLKRVKKPGSDKKVGRNAESMSLRNSRQRLQSYSVFIRGLHLNNLIRFIPSQISMCKIQLGSALLNILKSSSQMSVLLKRFLG